MSVLIATDYEILRQVPVGEREQTTLARKPVRVATLLNEQKFIQSGGILSHNDTVFLEDQFHDWRWTNGILRYYTRISKVPADIVVVYAYAKS